jgi:hypothetical protein
MISLSNPQYCLSVKTIIIHFYYIRIAFDKFYEDRYPFRGMIVLSKLQLITILGVKRYDTCTYRTKIQLSLVLFIKFPDLKPYKIIYK